MKFSGLNAESSAKFCKIVVAAALAGVCGTAAGAQQVAVAAMPEPVPVAVVSAESVSGSSSSAAATAISALPEAPTVVTSEPSTSGRLVASLPATAFGAPNGNNVAPKYAKYIASDETAQPINAHDKVVIGLRDLYSVESLLAIVSSAGYEQLTNGEPNYIGTPFGKRVGAAAVRETSQGLFMDVILDPIMRFDPRYYAAGEQTGFVHRTVYAVSRVLVGRTDSGRQTVNAPLLLGYAATSAMTPLYYPDVNHNFRDVASGYGGSLGGAAVGFLFSEFSDSLLETFHFKKRP